MAIFSLLVWTNCAQAATIQNDVFRKDQSGNPIHSQGGGILKVGNTYYWYGVNYSDAATYAAVPSAGNKGGAVFKSVTCYSSTDLPKGVYTLSAWVESSGGQNSAVLAAKNFGGTDLSCSLAKTIGNWTLVSIPGIKVTNGKCQVAIVSNAKAQNWVRVDDISLIKTSLM